MKLRSFLVLGLMIFCVGTSFCNDDDDRQGFGIELPESKPKPAAASLESFENNKRYAKLFELRAEVIELFREREALNDLADPREAKRAKRKLEQVEQKLYRAKQKFYREAKRIRDPWTKDFEKVDKIYQDLMDKSAKAAEQGNDARSTKFAQEADKHTGKRESLQRNIDLINYFLFFDEYEKTEIKEVDKKPEEGKAVEMKKDKIGDKDGEKQQEKKARRQKSKKSKKADRD